MGTELRLGHDLGPLQTSRKKDRCFLTCPYARVTPSMSDQGKLPYESHIELYCSPSAQLHYKYTDADVQEVGITNGMTDLRIVNWSNPDEFVKATSGYDDSWMNFAIGALLDSLDSGQIKSHVRWGPAERTLVGVYRGDQLLSVYLDFMKDKAHSNPF